MMTATRPLERAGRPGDHGPRPGDGFHGVRSHLGRVATGSGPSTTEWWRRPRARRSKGGSRRSSRPCRVCWSDTDPRPRRSSRSSSTPTCARLWPWARRAGVTLLACSQAGCEVFEYTPQQVKQAVVGYGKADKEQVMEMVRVLLGLTELPRPDHAADALGVAICHANTCGMRERVRRQRGGRCDPRSEAR